MLIPCSTPYTHHANDIAKRIVITIMAICIRNDRTVIPALLDRSINIFLNIFLF